MITKIENYITSKLQFDAKYVLRGSFWLLIGHAFSVSAVLATSYFFANYLDPQLFGNYRYLLAASVIISLFSLSGLDNAVIQATAKKIPNYFRKALITSLQYGLIITLVALILSSYYFHQGNALLALGLLLIAIIQPLLSSSNLVFSYLYGQQKFKTSTKWHSLKTVITSAAIVASILLSGDVVIILLTYLISNVISNTIPLYWHFPKHEKDDDADKDTAFTNYAKHTSIQNLIIGAANQLDKLLIFQTLGAKELATYVFATAIPDQYKGITKTIDTLLLPRFSKYKTQTVKNSLYKKSILYFILLCVCALVYIVVAPAVFAVLYPTYEDSILLSQIYVLGIIFGFGNIPFSAMKASMDNKMLYQYKFVFAVFQIVSLVVLLTLFGLLGAIIARVLHRGFVCVYGYYLYFKSK